MYNWCVFNLERILFKNDSIINGHNIVSSSSNDNSMPSLDSLSKGKKFALSGTLN